jgi:hypothetical protein
VTDQVFAAAREASASTCRLISYWGRIVNGAVTSHFLQNQFLLDACA